MKCRIPPKTEKGRSQKKVMEGRKGDEGGDAEGEEDVARRISRLDQVSVWMRYTFTAATGSGEGSMAVARGSCSLMQCKHGVAGGQSRAVAAKSREKM